MFKMLYFLKKLQFVTFHQSHPKYVYFAILCKFAFSLLFRSEHPSYPRCDYKEGTNP